MADGWDGEAMDCPAEQSHNVPLKSKPSMFGVPCSHTIVQRSFEFVGNGPWIHADI